MFWFVLLWLLPLVFIVGTSSTRSFASHLGSLRAETSPPRTTALGGHSTARQLSAPCADLAISDI
eukprot:5874548-Alexandrium_andersonii.AAC.1